MGTGAEKVLQPPPTSSQARSAGGDGESDASSVISLNEDGLDEFDAQHGRQDEDKDGSSSAGTHPVGTGWCASWRMRDCQCNQCTQCKSVSAGVHPCEVQINASRSQSVSGGAWLACTSKRCALWACVSSLYRIPVYPVCWRLQCAWRPQGRGGGAHLAPRQPLVTPSTAPCTALCRTPRHTPSADCCAPACPLACVLVPFVAGHVSPCPIASYRSLGPVQPAPGRLEV